VTNNNQVPIVSVIVPCHNYGQFIHEALQSVSAQTFSQWECIVVDNDSTDNTSEIVAQIQKNDKRFKYMFQKNKGVSSARNTGIKQSSGKYILPLDADDKIGKTYLEKAIGILEENKKIKIVYCKAEYFGDITAAWNLPEYDIHNMLIESHIFCSGLYKRTDYELTGGYSEEMEVGFEDWDFWLTLLSAGGEVYQIPEVLFYYRIRSSSRNNLIAANKDQQRVLRQIIYQRHKDLYTKYLSIPDLIQDYINIRNEMAYIKAQKRISLPERLKCHLKRIKELILK
jgi:glycosyltransferase involved in cell wall biosynthesis